MRFEVGSLDETMLWPAFLRPATVLFEGLIALLGWRGFFKQAQGTLVCKLDNPLTFLIMYNVGADPDRR